MAHIQDLVQQVQSRLSKESLDNLELTNSAWSLPGGFWRTHFLRTYGASLPIGVDYELEIAVLEGSDKRDYYSYILKQQYNKLFRLEDIVDKERLLVEASQWGNIDIVKLLLDNGADIHAKDDFALRWAAEKGHIDIIVLLLDNGANIHAEDDYSLRWAAGNGHLDIVKLLLDRGADIHADDDFALRWAALNGHANVVKLLLDNGADIHAGNDYSLRWAASNCHLDVVKLLLSKGANIDVLRGDNGFPSEIVDYISSLSNNETEPTQCTSLTLKKTCCKKKAVRNGLCSIHPK